MFTGLSSLTTLVIVGFKQLTRIVSLPATLKRIKLINNCINVIEPDAFHLLDKLKYLHLYGNKLTADSSFPALGHLASIEELSLHGNIIDSLEGLKSIRLPSLRVLNLHNCKVNKLSKQTFATLPGLVNLDLGKNEITEIEVGAFDGMLNLRVLSLHENKLKEFCFNLFESEANKLGSPVNLTSLWLDDDSIQSVLWSSETKTLVDVSMLEAGKKNKTDDDVAAKQFAKCGFRNKLDVGLKKKYRCDFSFVVALAAKGLVRLSFNHLSFDRFRTIY
jgi:Leucine-rich repeat (LRR) protein